MYKVVLYFDKNVARILLCEESCENYVVLLQIERLARADSDFTGFLHHAGIPSLDMYYGNGN